MGKICWINGQPYSVSLPTGGLCEGDRNNQWDEIIDFLGENCNGVFHWKKGFSWCQEVANHMSFRRLRGYVSARSQSLASTCDSFLHLGFRPVFVPLNPVTLDPDPELLRDIPDGQVIALASLYLDGDPIDLSENKKPRYRKETEIVLGDRDKNSCHWLYVIKYGDLLWADRNVLVNISWDELQNQGYAD